MRTKQNLALRPYLETIEGYCRPLDKEKLLKIVLALAGEVALGERAAFLARVAALLPGAAKKAGKGELEALLDRIKDLRQAIRERIAAIEDGTFGDEDDDYGGYYHDDQEAEYLGDDQKEALAACFGEADRFFMSGRPAAAKTIYARLFDLLREMDAAAGVWLDLDVDLRETRARYCRCAYELADEKTRAREMVAAMEVEAKGHAFDDEPGDYPLLRDILDAQSGDLQNFAAFLPAWEKALAAKGFSNGRLARLRLEAAFMRDGVTAVAHLAREWKDKQPKGYMVWLERLGAAGEWPMLRDAAQEALDVLAAGEAREAAAGFLVTAGEQLKDDVTLLTGKRERFCSAPKAGNLLSLLAEAGRQEVRERELAAAISLLAGQKKGQEFTDHSLPVKALLMAGRLGEAMARVQKAKPVGWSYDSSAGVVLAAVLHLVAGGNPDFLVIQELLRDYAGQGRYYFDDSEPGEERDASFYQEITLGLGLAAHEPAELARHHAWARQIGEARINHIVSNKHRVAYDRAAKVLAALAEALVATGEKGAAEHLLHDYYQVRYNRYAAFRKEVKEVVGHSPALGWVRF